MARKGRRQFADALPVYSGPELVTPAGAAGRARVVRDQELRRSGFAGAHRSPGRKQERRNARAELRGMRGEA